MLRGDTKEAPCSGGSYYSLLLQIELLAVKPSVGGELGGGGGEGREGKGPKKTNAVMSLWKSAFWNLKKDDVDAGSGTAEKPETERDKDQTSTTTTTSTDGVASKMVGIVLNSMLLAVVVKRSVDIKYAINIFSGEV